jgi:DNA repair protein SbcD/Mre11
MNTILHTSDWHLGQRLERQERAPEQQAFLDWLLAELEGRKADALIVCGDLFDVANPPIDAVRMLYGFLARARQLCPNIILTAGNHDSGARLDAMGALAAELGITIIGAMPKQPADCIVPLVDRSGRCFARLAAVPYLRSSDLLAASPDEDVAAQHGRVLTSIKAIYADVLIAAKSALQHDEALIVTGHLFARGGNVGEGERPAHVEAGNLLAVPTSIFGERASYVALGHLHGAQRVSKEPPAWYSGTPVSLSFSDGGRTQSVQLVTFDKGVLRATESLPVPRARELYDVVGDRERVFQRLEELATKHPEEGSSAWLRVTVEVREPDPGLRDAVREALAGSSLHLIAVRVLGVGEGGGLADGVPLQKLEELSPEGVFEILHQERYGEPPDGALVDAFAELLQEVRTGEEAT